ncbi:MAG: hypothetical protein K2Y56_17225 [Methylobacterium sp.]|uniref:hypothetical protein n=1 Tax=Methylobacterium sp. TaxID=409 RepID=UPI0025E73852|nr:hypothetical protein [Methylobacterium sp.]MBX9933248.1 hypothetical protein [Methylobacterium sp.]
MTTFTCAVGFFVLTCQGPHPVPNAARFCQTASLVRYSAQDTAETRRQLRVANAKYRAVCGDR